MHDGMDDELFKDDPEAEARAIEASETAAAAAASASAVPGADAAPSELSSLVGSVEAVLGCLLRVRASL
jgi:hypothetical protein